MLPFKKINQDKIKKMILAQEEPFDGSLCLLKTSVALVSGFYSASVSDVNGEQTGEEEYLLPSGIFVCYDGAFEIPVDQVVGFISLD